MTKAENVIKYYVLCNKLKDIIRTGWKNWNVKRDRVESIAEHIFGVQMLAIAMKSEYQYDIDIEKVIFMLAVHELEEIEIGDLTWFDIKTEEKNRIGHAAVGKVLEGLLDKEEIMTLILEFDERKTKEACFAHYCDKLECDLQCKLYDEEGCVDINNQKGNKVLLDERVQRLMESEKSWSCMWMTFDQDMHHFDEHFTEVIEYAKEHKIGFHKQ